MDGGQRGNPLAIPRSPSPPLPLSPSPSLPLRGDLGPYEIPNQSVSSKFTVPSVLIRSAKHGHFRGEDAETARRDWGPGGERGGTGGNGGERGGTGGGSRVVVCASRPFSRLASCAALLY
jgi:hypothetical protein